MSFGSNTHRNRLLTLSLVLLIPLSVLAAVDDQELSAAKDEFNQLWHAAAETTQKKANLEQVLAKFDGKVATARKEMEKASEQRKLIREQINSRQVFAEALQQQLQANDNAKAFYDAVAFGQRDDFVKFLRYMTSRNIALTESGPAAGGPLLKHIIRGSLGDSIDDALAFDALLKARTQFLGQVRALVHESDKTHARLKQVAEEYDAQIKLLEEEQRNIASVVDTKKQFIDDSWKEKILTQEELQHVAEEANEANARFADIQSSLVQISQELKQASLKKLEQEVTPLQTERKEQQDQHSALERKDEAMRLIQVAAEKTFQTAIAGKNTDKKLYQKIESKNLRRQHASEEIVMLESQKTLSGSEVQAAKITALEAEIQLIDDVLAYMKNGIPADLAESYILARRRADDATESRRILQKKIADSDLKLGELKKMIVTKNAESEAAQKQYELNMDMPSFFVWPVNGRITAGYLDSAYVKVFGVPHRAVDIAVPQATPVRSVSDGVVFAVKDGGATGYSYILIGHRNGYASLYGHVSSSFVRSGDMVNAGQVIALSGGRPGTHGAGHMTTGAHLHLEITKNGAHVDPLTVLSAR